MFVTLSGIVIDISPEPNAQDAMLVTPSGIVIDVSPLQPEKAPDPTIDSSVIVTQCNLAGI